MNAAGYRRTRLLTISRYRDGLHLKGPRKTIILRQQSGLRVQDFAFLKGNSEKTKQMGKFRKKKNEELNNIISKTQLLSMSSPEHDHSIKVE
jgi:hypothetical protein